MSKPAATLARAEASLSPLPIAEARPHQALELLTQRAVVLPKNGPGLVEHSRAPQAVQDLASTEARPKQGELTLGVFQKVQPIEHQTHISQQSS